jgi:hypothetical protein
MKLRKTHHLIFPILLFLLAIQNTCHATDGLYEQHIARGISDIEADKFKDAAEEFNAALREKPDDPTATLYLGIALSRSGDREAEAVLKRALSMNPQEPRTNLEIGIHYFGRGLYDEARDYFENTIKLSPDTDLSRRAEEYLRFIERKVAPKRWGLNISIGGQYDSNVVLNTEDSPLPQGISDESDWRGVLYLKGRYSMVTHEKGEGSIGYSLYQSLHSELHDFNITQHLAELRGRYGISPILDLRGAYSFEYVYVGGYDYDFAHSITPSIAIMEGKGFSTIVEYRYRDSHFMDSDLFANNSERTGVNNLIGITQNIPLRPSISARVGYTHDEDSTRKEYWDYKGDKGFMGVRFSMPYRVLLDIYGEYYRKGYEGVNPISGSKRRDTIQTYSASATKAFTERHSMTMGYSYIDNDSNLDIYTYKRGITSLFLNARF